MICVIKILGQASRPLLGLCMAHLRSYSDNAPEQLAPGLPVEHGEPYEGTNTYRPCDSLVRVPKRSSLEGARHPRRPVQHSHAGHMRTWGFIVERACADTHPE